MQVIQQQYEQLALILGDMRNQMERQEARLNRQNATIDQLLENYDKSKEDQNASSEVFNKNDKSTEQEQDFLDDIFGTNEDSKEENDGEEDDGQPSLQWRNRSEPEK
ncbi:hypothetical protein GH714_016525 [Hevea brasiliensis]|uniref:Uncharacterized protein n=1 Tax=Hevea brasiliensis TaxID=3981 RepID=A0A6A6LSR8_HEVBR|nr:hypothetical protein GH714_016525 [Hevea brasiliensis]